MLRLDKILKTWKEAAATADHINLYGFWNETAFLTKSGDLGMALRVTGVDYESLDHGQQENAVKRLEAALKNFGPGFHVYQYLFKTDNPEIPFAEYDEPIVQTGQDRRRELFESKADQLFVPNGTNYFSPIWPSGQGMVMAQMGGGSGDLTFYGINWNGSSTAQSFPSAFMPVLNLNYNGSVGIGTTNPGAKLEIDGNVKLTSGSGASITFQDGTVQSTAYTGVLPGGDYADSVDVNGDRAKYGAGDLLVIDPDHPGKFLKSAEPYSTSVAGIFSTKPGTLGRRQTGPKNPDEVPMAMVGIVPTKVSAENGAIRPGDLLVTASLPGYAMKGTDRNRMLGAVVGKALGKLDSGTGVIEVVVTLQ